MIIGCEKDSAFLKATKNAGLSSIYFDYPVGALYCITDNEKISGYMLLKGVSAYLLFDTPPSDDLIAEISEFFGLMGVFETVSNVEIFENMTPLYVLEMNKLNEKRVEAEIKTASGRGYDGCYDLLWLSGFALPGKDEFYVTSFERAKSGAPTYYIEEEGVLATASVLCVSEERALLGAVATHPEKRGRGYAGALVSHAAREMLKKGKTPVITYFAENAGRLYKSLGFEEKARLFKKNI